MRCGLETWQRFPSTKTTLLQGNELLFTHVLKSQSKYPSQSIQQICEGTCRKKEKIIMSGVGFEPTNRYGLVLKTNCVDRLHTLTVILYLFWVRIKFYTHCMAQSLIVKNLTFETLPEFYAIHLCVYRFVNHRWQHRWYKNKNAWNFLPDELTEQADHK